VDDLSVFTLLRSLFQWSLELACGLALELLYIGYGIHWKDTTLIYNPRSGWSTIFRWYNSSIWVSMKHSWSGGHASLPIKVWWSNLRLLNGACACSLWVVKVQIVVWTGWAITNLEVWAVWFLKCYWFLWSLNWRQIIIVLNWRVIVVVIRLLEILLRKSLLFLLIHFHKIKLLILKFYFTLN